MSNDRHNFDQPLYLASPILLQKLFGNPSELATVAIVHALYGATRLSGIHFIRISVKLLATLIPWGQDEDLVIPVSRFESANSN